jgi:hypothetical protein
MSHSVGDDDDTSSSHLEFNGAQTNNLRAVCLENGDSMYFALRGLDFDCLHCGSSNWDIHSGSTVRGLGERNKIETQASFISRPFD